MNRTHHLDYCSRCRQRGEEESLWVDENKDWRKCLRCGQCWGAVYWKRLPEGKVMLGDSIEGKRLVEQPVVKEFRETAGKPLPGSPEAVEQGCLCPEIDNARGAGACGTSDKPAREKLYWITEGCPLHSVLIPSDLYMER